MALISRLGVVLGLDTGEFNEKLGVANEKLEKFSTSLKVGLGAAATAAAGFIIEATKKAAEYADEMGKAAQKIGVTTEALSKLKYAANLSDVSFEALQTGLKKLSVNMESAATGNKAMGDAFKSFGVSVTNSKGDLKSADEVLYQLADTFAKMPDGVQKTAMAVKVFGKTGQDLIPLLNGGAKALKDAGIEAENFGMVVTEKAAKSAEKFNDNMKRMKEASEGLSISIGNKFIPALSEIFEDMVKIEKEQGLFIAALYGIGDAIHKMIYGSTDTESANLRARLKSNIESIQKEIKALIDQNDPNYHYIMGDGRDRLLRQKYQQLQIIETQLAIENKKAAEKAADDAKNDKPVKDPGNLPPVVDDSKKKLTEELIKQTNELKLQTSLVGQIQSEAQKVALEFQTGGKYVEYAGTSYQKTLMAAAQGLDIKKHEAVVQKVIVDYQDELQKKTYDTFIAGQKITNSVIERHKADQLAYDLNMKDLQVSIDRANYEATLAGMADIEKQRLLALFDVKAKINKEEETNVNLTDEQIAKQKELMDAKVAADDANKRAQNTFQAGWSKALNDFKLKAIDSASAGEQAFNNMTNGLESALDNFVKTGKLSFSSLIQSMISDLIKFQMKAAMTGIFGGGGGLSDMFSGIFGNNGGVSATAGAYSIEANPYLNWAGPAAANGGDINGMTLVGEKGPELFVPKTAGTIIPNNNLSSMMGNQPQTVYNGTVIQNMSAIDTQSGIQFLAKNKAAVWSANMSAQRSMPQNR
jgi:lambda family phage tail tape measure protein